MDYEKIAASTKRAIIDEIHSGPRQVGEDGFARVIAAGIVAALAEQEAQANQ